MQYKNETNRPKTLFEEKLKELNIKYKLINPYTPNHNEKVDSSHKKEQERFYYNKVFFSFKNLVNRAKYYIKEYNNFSMRPLKWLSTKDKYEEYKLKFNNSIIDVSTLVVSIKYDICLINLNAVKIYII